MSPDVGCSLAQGARHLHWLLTGFPHRLLPLQCVKLTVYSRLQHCLRLRFPSGRKVYLQLFPGPRAEELFLHWAVLVTMLPVPGEPCVHLTPAEEPVPREEACSVGVTEAKVEAEVKVPATDPSMGETLTTGETAGTDKAPPASSTPEVRTETGVSPTQGRRFRQAGSLECHAALIPQDVPHETSAGATRHGSNIYLNGTCKPLATSAREMLAGEKKLFSGEILSPRA